MLAQKIITTTRDIELDIQEVTLLSDEEYDETKQYIQAIYNVWWLRSPGDYQYYAALVYFDGSLFSYYVNIDNAVVRPVLKIANLKSLNFSFGDRVYLADLAWTVISNEYAICDSDIGHCCFRKDCDAQDANVYEESDVKKYIENWVKEKGIELSNKEE